MSSSLSYHSMYNCKHVYTSYRLSLPYRSYICIFISRLSSFVCVCACVRACVCTYCWHDYDCDTRVTIQLDWITNTLTLSALITNLLTHRTQESLSKTGGHWYAFDCIHTNIEFETGTHISISNEEVTCEVCHIHVMVCLFDTQHNKQFNNLIKQISANIIQVYVVKYLKIHHRLASHHSLCLLYYDTYI